MNWRPDVCLLILLLLPAFQASAQLPKTSPSYANEELKLKLSSPKDVPLEIRTEGLGFSIEGQLCHFMDARGSTASVDGGLFHNAKGLVVADYAKWFEDEYRKNNPNVTEFEQTSESKLDNKPGEWLLRIYRSVESESKFFCYHIYVADGQNNYAIAMRANSRFQPDEKSIQAMSAVVSKLTITATAPDGGRTEQPLPPVTNGDKDKKPRGNVKPVAGILYVTTGVNAPETGFDIMLLRDGLEKPINICPGPGPDKEPAWSPDATKIVFVSGRSPGRGAGQWTDGIYLMDSDGADVTKLTEGDDNSACNPCWSPDGSKIAFVKHEGAGGKEIFSMNADGSGLQRLTQFGEPDEHPDWSPDGSKIVFTRSNRIWVMNADGTDPKRIDAFNQGRHPRWSPDGKKIIFTYLTTTNGGTIMIMDADGSNLITSRYDDDQVPQFMPKMNKIAFIGFSDNEHDRAGPDVYVKNTRGTQVVNITEKFGGAIDFDVSPLAADDALSATVPCDITYTRMAGNGSFDIVVSDEHGKTIVDLTQSRLDGPGNGGKDEQPCWSPNRKKIAYVSSACYYDPKTGHPHFDHANIHVMDADGSNDVNLTQVKNVEQHPTWSPDGTRIAFIRSTDLWIMNTAGGEQRRLMGPGARECAWNHMSWSRDGSVIVVSQAGKLFTVDAAPPATPGDPNAAAWTELPIASTGALDPDFSPATDRIAFFGNEPGTGKWALRIFDFPAGPEVTVTTELSAGTRHPSWSPEGKRIAFEGYPGGNPSSIEVINEDGTGRSIITKPETQDIHPDWGAGPHKYEKKTPTALTMNTGKSNCVLLARWDEKTRSSKIYRLSLDGAKLDELATIANTDFYFPIRFSPDGSKALASIKAADNILFDLTEVDLKTGKSRVIAQGRDGLYSPDGQRIAYLSEDGRTNPILSVMSADGSGGRRRDGDAPQNGDTGVSFSPDGAKILFNSDMGPSNAVTSGVYTVNADGSNLTKLVILPSFKSFAPFQFSPDGTKLASTAYGDKNAVYTMNADGSDLTVVLDGRNLTTGDYWAADGSLHVSKPDWRGVSKVDPGTGQETKVYDFQFVHPRVNSDRTRMIQLYNINNVLKKPNWERGATIVNGVLNICDADGKNMKVLCAFEQTTDYQFCYEPGAPGAGMTSGQAWQRGEAKVKISFPELNWATVSGSKLIYKYKNVGKSILGEPGEITFSEPPAILHDGEEVELTVKVSGASAQANWVVPHLGGQGKDSSRAVGTPRGTEQTDTRLIFNFDAKQDQVIRFEGGIRPEHEWVTIEWTYTRKD